MSIILFNKEIHGHGIKDELGFRSFLYCGNSNIELGTYLRLSLGIKVDCNDEDFFTLSLGLLFLRIYLTINVPFTRWFWNKFLSKSKGSKYHTGCRIYGITLDTYSLSTYWHYDDSGMSCTKGFQWALYKDTIAHHYYPINEELTGDRIEVIMDVEYGNVTVKDVAFGITYHVRDKVLNIFGKKFLRKEKLRTVEVECLSHRFNRAGKGENSWDCGDDYTTSITFPDEKNSYVNQTAIEKFMDSCNDDLRRRGLPSGKLIRCIPSK